MSRTGRLILILLLANALVFGSRWWQTAPRYPITRDAADLVLRAADLPEALQPVPAETRPIADNPYADHTEHYRSGHSATFAGAGAGEWGRTRVISATFVLSRQGAEKVYLMYRNQLRYRGEEQSLPPLGQASHFILARDEPAAPVVVVGVVRVENVLITLTVLSDRGLDPALAHRWAGTLVERAAGVTRGGAGT